MENGIEANQAAPETNAEAQAGEEAIKPAVNITGGKGKWYIVQAHANFEQKVAAAIKEQAVQDGLTEEIEEVYVPMEEIVEMKRGKKVTSERKFFPGYVMVKMQLTDASWHMVKSIAKVSGFLGGSKGSKPMPMTNSEAAAIFNQVEEGATTTRSTIIFEIGESIKVCDGPFDGFVGKVENVDEEKQRVKVSVAIFGRPTPVDLEYSQVEKVD